MMSAVVSGGGTGLGLQITRELLSLGCDVLICSRSEQKLSAACAALAGVARAGGCRVIMRACNVKKEAEVRALFEELSRLGEALESRFEMEDLLIEHLHNAHAGKVASA